MRNPIEEAGLLTEEFRGNYRGLVVKVDDPKKLGRCRIRVMPMMRLLEDDDLPWATPAKDTGDVGVDVGSLIVPDVNSWVWVFFEAGDIRIPQYTGSAPHHKGSGKPTVPKKSLVIDAMTAGKQSAGDVEEPEYTDTSEYPHSKQVRTKSGNYYEIDDTPGKEEITWFNKVGSWIKFFFNGDVVLHAKKDLYLITEASLKALAKTDFIGDIAANWKMKVGTELEFTIGSNKVKVDSSSVTIEEAGGAKLTLQGGQVMLEGTQVVLAGGGPPVARLGDTSIGIGNAGAPVISNITQGSPRVTSG